MTKERFSVKIRQLREERGMTQAELAEKSGLTVRSIQRLEKGDNKPRGDTLKRLCDVFDVSVGSLIIQEKTENLLYLIILALSALAFLINPLLGVVIPFLLWLFKRKSISKVDELGKRVMNFQITWFVFYFLFQLLVISLVIGRFTTKGELSEFNMTELLVRKVFISFMHVSNLALILLSTFFIYRTGHPRVLFGFAFNKFSIRPVFMTLFVLTNGILLSGLINPNKLYKEREKADVIRFAKEVIQIPYMADGSHKDSLKQHLHPAIDTVRLKNVINGYFIPWGKVDSDLMEIKEYGFSVKRSQSHYLKIIYNDVSSHRLFRYLFQIEKLNGRYYIRDYYCEDLSESIFEVVELKKRKGEFFWRVETPFGRRAFRNNQLVTYGPLRYKDIKQSRENSGYLFHMENGKLKKQKILNSP